MSLSQHSDVGNIQDVIATLEYDIQAVKKKIHMEEIQGITTCIYGTSSRPKVITVGLICS